MPGDLYVRWIGWIIMLLMTVGWAAAELPLAEPSCAGLAATDWRYTSEGWQRPTWLDASIPTRRPALHPGVIGALQLLLSLMALVAFPAFRGGVGGKDRFWGPGLPNYRRTAKLEGVDRCPFHPVAERR